MDVAGARNYNPGKKRRCDVQRNQGAVHSLQWRETWVKYVKPSSLNGYIYIYDID